MPALECPLGADCTKGLGGGIWKTAELPFEQALILIKEHTKYAHQATGTGTHQTDGASGAPTRRSTGDNLNVNQGAQGGNFDHCDVQNNTFNNYTPGGDLFSQNYQKMRFIGNGRFGEIWIVKPKNVSDSKEFIMKEITEENAKAGRNEINMLKNCQNIRIISYIEDFYENSKIQIIMEYCEGGDLAKFIEAQSQFLGVELIIDWFIQLTSGVCFIHSKKIIHRDLKTENIFLTLNRKLKIGDFGKANRFIGNADIRSLGIIFFEIITFKKPFHGHDWRQVITKE